MQLFQSYDSYTFKFNGIKYVKNFMIIKQGQTNISIHNAFDVSFQLLASTHYSQVSVDGVTFTNQADLMSALSTMLFAKQIVDLVPSYHTHPMSDIVGLNAVLSGFSTSTSTAFTGGTVTGATNFTGGLTATTISATTYYGDGSNLTGITTTIPTLQILTSQPSGNTTTNPILFIGTGDTSGYTGTFSTYIQFTSSFGEIMTLAPNTMQIGNLFGSQAFISNNNLDSSFTFNGLPRRDGTIAVIEDIEVFEAPISGITYGRKDGAWYPISGSIPSNIYVPYSGATQDVNLGDNSITANSGFNSTWTGGNLYAGTEYDSQTRKIDFNSGINDYLYSGQQCLFLANAEEGINFSMVGNNAGGNLSGNIVVNPNNVYITSYSGTNNNQLIVDVNQTTSTKKVVSNEGFYAPIISATTYLNLPTDNDNYLPLSGGTVSGSLAATSISATTYQNLPTIISQIGYKPFKWVNTSNSTHTGTVSETIIASTYISGGTFNSSDVMKVITKYTKPTGAGTIVTRVKINTTNTLSGAVGVARLDLTSANTYGKMNRDFDLYGGNLLSYNQNSSVASDVSAGNTTGSSTAYNTANDLYVFYTVQLGSTGDTITCNLQTISN